MVTIGLKKFHRNKTQVIDAIYRGEIVKVINTRSEEAAFYIVPPDRYTVEGVKVVETTSTEFHLRLGKLRVHIRRGFSVLVRNGTLKEDVCYLVHPQYIQEEDVDN